MLLEQKSIAEYISGMRWRKQAIEGMIYPGIR